MPLHRVPKRDRSSALEAKVAELEKAGHTITYIGDTALEWVIVSGPPPATSWGDHLVEKRAG